MDVPSLLAKIVGLILLAWTIKSIVQHIKQHKAAKDEGQEVASLTEQALNNILLYLWLGFMLVFSSGMILNN